MTVGRPNFDAKCTCAHLGVHHSYDAPYWCNALGGDCDCVSFTSESSDSGSAS